jgi:glycine dehydrogenase subunit 2
VNEPVKLRKYHSAKWDEPVVMELGRKGRRGVLFPAPEAAVRDAVGDALGFLPSDLRRQAPPALPEMSEYEVLRHYLALSQEVLGMMGISLFGTCTMKYNPSLNEQLTSRPEVAEIHPLQDTDTIQGLLEIVHGCDLMLRELSGMDQFTFQPGGGAHGAYCNSVVTRAYHASRGELERRNQVIVTIQTHPCCAATAAAAGFEVVTLMLEEGGYPSVDALRSVVSDRTAALMVNNPDDMGIYNPHIKEWVDIVHKAGGLCFYDHANFNGVMGKIRARDLGANRR